MPPLVSLEGQGCGSIGGGGLEVGIRDSVSPYSTSFRDPHHSGFVFSPFRQGECSGGGDSGSVPQGCGRACASNSRVLQPHVRGHQGIRRVETYHRSLHPEPVGGEDVVPYGDHPLGSLFCLEKRLDGLYQPEGRVPSGTDSPIESQVSQVHSRREGLAVSGPLIRFVHVASSVHMGHGSCLRVPPSAGCPDASVSERLADSCVISGGSLLGEGQGSFFVFGSQDSCESREVVVDSFADHSLSGDQDRVANFPGFTDSLED